MELEKYFEQFRKNIIGINQHYQTPFGEKKLIYADWIASGRLYTEIEEKIQNEFGPFVGNTHTSTSEVGTLMTEAYHHAKNIIRKHIHANENDVVITYDVGMTGVINKFQRILGLKGCGILHDGNCLQEKEKPVVFITHMEHHSNQTSWYETHCDVVVLNPDKDLFVDLNELKTQLEIHKDRKFKIGSFSACSNVTGIINPYHEMAKIMHEYNGICLVDFAASAPYVDIDMHPDDPMMALDAIFFSPHKFLGGPGSCGVLVFNKKLYSNASPDQPGGGTVDWTNRWGEYKFSDDIEAREDGGTPGFLQAIRTALSIQLKEKIGTKNIHLREKELLKIVFDKLEPIENLHILAGNAKERIGAFSFYIEDAHYNLVVKLLNDRFGIQVRGGCSCAGTYGHFLLDVSYEQSQRITQLINQGDLSSKPGWIRLSIHPTMLNEEMTYICDSIISIARNHKELAKDYSYNCKSNEFVHQNEINKKAVVHKWFTF